MVGVSGLPAKQGSSDHFQTPEYALDILIPYLNKEWLIWEPACGKGNILNYLGNKGFKIIGNDIIKPEGEGYGNFLVDKCICKFDCIVTNPTYTIKQKFLEKCYELGRPFALLLPLTALESEKRQKLFRKYGLQLIIPNKRVDFETPSGQGSSAWFATAWFTWGLGLPKDLNFVEVNW